MLVAGGRAPVVARAKYDSDFVQNALLATRQKEISVIICFLVVSLVAGQFRPGLVIMSLAAVTVDRNVWSRGGREEW